MSLSTRGIVYMLLSSLFFALMALSVKMMDRIPVLEIIFFRSLISIGLCLMGLWTSKIAPFGNKKGLLILRGVAGALALTQNFWLLQNIPLAAASTLTHMAPIFTTLIGIWFVQEKVAPRTLLWFGLCFVGVMLMQGFDYRISIWHLLVGVSASFTMGVAYNCVRKLGRTEHPLVIILYFPLVCLPTTGLWTYFYGVYPEGIEWLWIILVGIFTQLGQYFMTKSYQLAEIGKVAIFNYVGVIFAIIFGFFIFDENFNLLTYAGMALVLAGVVFSVMSKQKSSTSTNEDVNKTEEKTV